MKKDLTISDPYRITAVTIVRDNKVYRNGITVFESDATGIPFLNMAYEVLDNNYPKFFKMDALCKLGTIASTVLLKDFDNNSYKPEEVGIVLSNKNGSIEADINYFESSKSFPSPSLFVYTLPNIVIGEISIRNGFKGENAFFISEKFNACWIHFYVNDLMQQHGIKACVCGWADVVDEQYEAIFFLIEKEKENGINFTPENLNFRWIEKI